MNLAELAEIQTQSGDVFPVAIESNDTTFVMGLDIYFFLTIIYVWINGKWKNGKKWLNIFLFPKPKCFYLRSLSVWKTLIKKGFSEYQNIFLHFLKKKKKLEVVVKYFVQFQSISYHFQALVFLSMNHYTQGDGTNTLGVKESIEKNIFADMSTKFWPPPRTVEIGF